MHSQADHVRERSRIVFRIAGLCAALATALLIAAVAGAQDRQAREGTEPQAQATASEKSLLPQIMFTSTLDGNADIYRMAPEGTTEAVQLTKTDKTATGLTVGNAFAAAPPDGKRIVFDSNRDRATELPRNISDLYVMNADGMADGTEETHLIRGSSATWAPDSKHIAYHASASREGKLIFDNPGTATVDSDIFALNVYDRIENGAEPIKLTDTGGATIDDDADWTPDGQTIIFTSFPVTDPGTDLPPNTGTPVPHKEIYTKKADGTDANDPSKWINLTQNEVEDRAPAWSPDGTRIVFSCRRPTPLNNNSQRFKICVMDANGENEKELTNDEAPAPALTPTWTPDGQHIVFHRNTTFPTPNGERLFVMDAEDRNGDNEGDNLKQLTQPPAQNLLVKGGVLRVKD